MVDDPESPQSKGGRVRAARLTDEERHKIASVAAQARWEAANALPFAEFPGDLELGAVKIPCAVLSNGQRVLSENGITNAILGSRSGASKRLKKAAQDAGGAPLPLFVAPERLKPFISNEMIDGPFKPILYREGQRVAVGYDASILRAVCEVWLRAREAGALQKQQEDKAQRAELLMRALADIGIISLVDEATGYQKFRARDELQKILAAYISPELLPWSKRFPDSFYENLHRVRGWKYEPGSQARTAYIGKLTNSLIYDQLPKGVLEELKAKNPVDPQKKRRKHLHHRLLTEDVGHPHLGKQIASVTTLLRISENWPEFTKHFAKAFPPGPDDLFALPPPEKDKDA